MSAQRADRKLAAILAADVAGFGRLIGGNEERTLQRLAVLRRELLDPRIQTHRGRVFKHTGDGFLAEFASAVDAVRCALEIQSEMAQGGAGMHDEEQIQLRIGINVGDVVDQEGDVLGDGVNIAARLEGLAEPGGVLVSHTVHDHTRSNHSFRFDELGERSLKNIERPVRVFRVYSEDAGPVEQLPRPGSSARHLPLPEKPSIAVLPFDNLSGQPEESYFSDGITEEIITGPGSLPLAVRRCPQFLLCLPRQVDRPARDRTPARRLLPPRGERPARGRPHPGDGAADRG